MAENEVKSDDKKIGFSFWFFVFLIYLIFSLLFIMSQNDKIATLTAELDIAKAETITSNERNEYLVNSFTKDLEDLINKYAQLQASKEEEKPNIPAPVEITTGTYTGEANNDETTISMTLTLSENNIAALTLADEAAIDGVYSLAENTLVFNSNDGETTYSFSIVDANTLKVLVSDVELTLSK